MAYKVNCGNTYFIQAMPFSQSQRPEAGKIVFDIKQLGQGKVPEEKIS